MLPDYFMFIPLPHPLTRTAAPSACVPPTVLTNIDPKANDHVIDIEGSR